MVAHAAPLAFTSATVGLRGFQRPARFECDGVIDGSHHSKVVYCVRYTSTRVRFTWHLHAVASPPMLATLRNLASAARATLTARGAQAVSKPARQMSQLKVGIVGAGAVGTYFGVRLAELGHDVRFVISPGEAAPETLRVQSWQGSFELTAPHYVATASELAADGEALDWVLVGLKAMALDGDGAKQMARLVGPAVSDGTRAQLLMNGLGAEELAAECFGADCVHGGLVYGGFGRLAPDRVLHEGVPTELRGGSFIDCPAEIAAAKRLWGPADGGAPPPGAIAYVPQPCLRLAQWSKLAWNIPFNGATVAAGGSNVGTLWRSPDGRAAAIGLMREVVRAANADLEANGAAPRLDEEATIDTLCAITETMAEQDYVPSTTKDFLNGNRMEVDAIFKEPLRRAAKHGVDTPRLHTLAALLDLINEKQ